MDQNAEEAGIIATLIERFDKQRLPRALSIKERVDKGERLSEYDIAFLEEVFADANEMRRYVERHPEYHDLAAKAAALYKSIMDKALENEKKEKGDQ
ncbi:hypothetical protein [Zooshikella harenae]|uniref:Uncharacterized protein n=1 Tax=Zooshikella harenae TaxID=2827238 RepID=A0ABS5ZGZ9_9GAMM|nr:hypothetical protein [Zooshikella harenae]MBU2713058.1 hypothetical protein [Zooshikella harenae]